MNSIRSVNAASTFKPSPSIPLSFHRHLLPTASIDRTSGVSAASVSGSETNGQISLGGTGTIETEMLRAENHVTCEFYPDERSRTQPSDRLDIGERSGGFANCEISEGCPLQDTRERRNTTADAPSSTNAKPLRMASSEAIVATPAPSNISCFQDSSAQ